MRVPALALFMGLTATLPSRADPPRVVTDIAPVAAMVAQVMGDLGDAAPLIEVNADPHTFQLRPSQARRLARADLVVWIGPALSPWLEDSLDTLAPDAASLALLSLPDLPLRIENGIAEYHSDENKHDDHSGEHSDEHADLDDAEHDDHDQDADHAHQDDHAGDEDHAASGEHGHDHGPLDPHAWLDPANGAHAIMAIADKLSELDPENAEIYTANARDGIARLAALEQTLLQQLAPLHDTLLISQHESIEYFLTRFELTNATAISDVEGVPPGAAKIREVQQAIRQAKGSCLLSEAGTASAHLDTVDPDGLAQRTEIDPLGRDVAEGPDGYETLIGNMGRAVLRCLPT